MINFASLFGGVSRGASSMVNDLLDKPDTTIQQLLDIEPFLNEYKSGNNKIIQFMKYDKYNELVKYITVQGPANNQKKGYKFPMVAADLLSVEKDTAIEFFLPDGPIQVDVVTKFDKQFQYQVQDNDQQYLNEEPTSKSQQPINQTQVTEQKSSQQTSTNQATQHSQKIQEQVQEIKIQKVQKKTKIIKQIKQIQITKKQIRQPLMGKILSYFQQPINYTLAGYTCKVLTTLFTKKPTNFYKCIFTGQKNYVQLICNHIESKSVGDLVIKLLIFESIQFLQQKQLFFDHLVSLMSTVTQSHIISNLAYAVHQLIEKTSIYIKSKINIQNNQQIIQSYLKIFYRTEQVHKIINNTIQQNQNKSSYNCHILHAYLHHTQIETFNSFKLEQVLQTFIVKASAKLRDIPNKRTLGMGRVKIVQIFSFLIRKPKKVIQEQNNKANDLSKQLLQQLYIHQLISTVNDFFSILIKLVQSFQNNNILHNQVFKIFEAVLKQSVQNNSSLQLLLLNDQNVLLKFLVSQTEKDNQTRTISKTAKRKGYIGHVINLCKTIQNIQNNQLLTNKIKQTEQFNQILSTMVAADLIEINKNLAGYQMKKNPVHQIMFQKEDIIAAYAQFLSHCPKPQFQLEQKQSSQDQTPSQHEAKLAEQQAQRQLQQQELDQQKFNQVVANAQEVNQQQPKYWINHLRYDIQSLMEDVL